MSIELVMPFHHLILLPPSPPALNLVYFSVNIYVLMICHEKYTISYIKFFPEMPNLQPMMRKCTNTQTNPDCEILLLIFFSLLLI